MNLLLQFCNDLPSGFVRSERTEVSDTALGCVCLSHSPDCLSVRPRQMSLTAFGAKRPPTTRVRLLWDLHLVAETITLRPALSALRDATCSLGLPRHEAAIKADPVVIADGHIMPHHPATTPTRGRDCNRSARVASADA